MKRIPILSALIFSVAMLSVSPVLANCSNYHIGGGGSIHANGGGWIVTGAKVDDSVYVGPESAVCGTRTKISGNVRIIDSTVANVVISGNVIVRGSIADGFGHIIGNVRILDSHVENFYGRISGNAKILDGAHISEAPKIHDSAKVAGENTKVFGFAEVFGDAVVRDGAWIFGNGRVNSGRYIKNARIDTDQTIIHSKTGDELSNPIREQNSESSD